jgi:hypothetical protein
MTRASVVTRSHAVNRIEDPHPDEEFRPDEQSLPGEQSRPNEHSDEQSHSDEHSDEQSYPDEHSDEQPHPDEHFEADEPNRPKKQAFENVGSYWDTHVAESKRAMKTTRWKPMETDVLFGPGGEACVTPVFDEYWTLQDERDLERRWLESPSHHFLNAVRPNWGYLPLLKVCLRIFKLAPESVLRTVPDLEVDTSDNAAGVVDGRTMRNPIWSTVFCTKLARLATHPLFSRPEVLAFCIRYAVICREDDRRRLDFPCPSFPCPVLERLFGKNFGCSVHNRHSAERIRSIGNSMQPSVHSDLLRRLGQIIGEPAVYPRNEDGPLRVKSADLTALTDAVNTCHRHGSPMFANVELAYQSFLAGRGPGNVPHGIDEAKKAYKYIQFGVERKGRRELRAHGSDSPRRPESGLDYRSPSSEGDLDPQPRLGQRNFDVYEDMLERERERARLSPEPGPSEQVPPRRSTPGRLGAESLGSGQMDDDLGEQFSPAPETERPSIQRQSSVQFGDDDQGEQVSPRSATERASVQEPSAPSLEQCETPLATSHGTMTGGNMSLESQNELDPTRFWRRMY